MQIVIDIDEETYADIKKGKVYSSYRDVPQESVLAIANGIPLPKGHGDLKDMGNLQYVFDLTREDPIYSGKDIELAIKSMKSIIEADKGVGDADSD